MKLVTIDSREVGGRPGVLATDDTIIDLIAAPSSLSEAQWLPQSVISILSAGEQGLESVRRQVAAVTEADEDWRRELRRTGVLLPLDGTTLLPPIRRPGLILTCEKIELVGCESLEAAIIKSPHSVVGDAAHINVPWPDAAQLTGQAMLGAVVGRPVYRVDEHEALDAIAGYTLVADLSLPAPAENSADSWQAYIESKQFPGSCAMGPAIVTTDEVLDPPELSITTSVNGVDAAAGPAFSSDLDLANAIAKLSHTYGLRPGDVIAFGQGFGSRRLQLRENDRVCADLGGLMTLSFEVAFR